jgi:hypothetical protein
MSLTRELKEMWLFGPLRSLKEGEAKANAKIDEDAKAVAQIMDRLIKNGHDEKKNSDDKEDGEQAVKESDDDHEA